MVKVKHGTAHGNGFGESLICHACFVYDAARNGDVIMFSSARYIIPCKTAPGFLRLA